MTSSKQYMSHYAWTVNCAYDWLAWTDWAGHQHFGSQQSPDESRFTAKWWYLRQRSKFLHGPLCIGEMRLSRIRRCMEQPQFDFNDKDNHEAMVSSWAQKMSIEDSWSKPAANKASALAYYIRAHTVWDEELGSHQTDRGEVRGERKIAHLRNRVNDACANIGTNCSRMR